MLNMWDKILLAIGFMAVIGYIFYRIFLIILIKNRIIENKECCNAYKHKDYAFNNLDDKDEV